jgi:hypothetical protein
MQTKFGTMDNSGLVDGETKVLGVALHAKEFLDERTVHDPELAPVLSSLAPRLLEFGRWQVVHFKPLNRVASTFSQLKICPSAVPKSRALYRRDFELRDTSAAFPEPDATQVQSHLKRTES